MDMNGKRFSSKSEASSSTDDGSTPYIPIIKRSELSKVVPKYAAVLEDTITMDDLDQLQQDLEKLLSTCAVRNRLLRSEEERRDKKGKQYEKPSLKRKRPDEKLRSKDQKSGTRLIKKHYPVNSLITDQVRHEVPKVNLIRNDTSDKFWSSIEAYCADLTKDDVTFLDSLIKECSKEIDVKIPELGVHYTQEWNEEVMNEDQSLMNVQKPKNFSNNDLPKNSVSAFSSPITHRLLALLLEQRVTPVDKLKGKYSTDLSLHKAAGSGGRAGLCMDRRLQKELVEQGILSIEDLPKTVPEDEILTEIKKCQQELAAINEYNLEELNKLRNAVTKDLRRQELKEELDKVDAQILDIYNKVLLSKQKHVQQNEDDILGKGVKCVDRDLEAQADAAIKQQLSLHKEITEMTTVPMIN